MNTGSIILVAVLAVLVLGLVVWFVRRPRGADTLDGVVTPPAPPPAAHPAPTVDAGLRNRLSRTRKGLADRLGVLFARAEFDQDLWDDLQDALIAADVGVPASEDVVAAVRQQRPESPSEARMAVQHQLEVLFAGKERGLNLVRSPATILVVGVNGTGKTTSIAKLAGLLQSQGKSVVLGAADTFRAAADEQLRTWAERVGVNVVTGRTGADPASVAFEAYELAKTEGHDVVIVDTAGRLQTKANLMDELTKIARILRREAGELDEVLLVLDGTTGQNALEQARAFTDAVGVTGIVLTKLDGTARGGIAVAVERELGIPVKYIGVGEGVNDLIAFEPTDFVDALLGE